MRIFLTGSASAAMGHHSLFSSVSSMSVLCATSAASGGSSFLGASIVPLPAFCHRASTAAVLGSRNQLLLEERFCVPAELQTWSLNAARENLRLRSVTHQRNIISHSVHGGARASSGTESSGRHVIITGANSGIGKATALELAKKGMVVTIACRNADSGKEAAQEISRAANNASVRSMRVDLDSLQSIRQFADEYKDTGLPLHVLVNNAGIMACPQAYTQDDFERQLGVNHLGHFLLTSLLLDNLVASASPEQKSRVVVLSSRAEQIGEIDFNDLNYKGSRGYNNWGAYGQSKLANALFSYELAKRSRQLGLPIVSNSIHPGIVMTNLSRYVFPSFTRIGELPPVIEGLSRSFFRVFGLKTSEEGASTSVFLASSPEVENSTGLYYEDCKVSTPSLNARNPRLASQLWDVSTELTGASSALEPLGLASKVSTVA